MPEHPTLFPPAPARDPERLMRDGLAVIDAAVAAGAEVMCPLFSSGNDSQCACHLASKHGRFGGRVYLIDTGIGAAAAGAHAGAVCDELGWELVVLRSPFTYERFVREFGFPGPGRHHWVYLRIKDRCVRQLVRGRRKVALVTGCRSAESTRRMGHVAPVKVGEAKRRNGRRVVEEKNRVWTAPCHDWSAEEQRAYMAHFGLTPSPVKAALGMSGECFCGAFAAPGELARVRAFCPDVAAEIDRLAAVAREGGKHAAWGTRPPADGRGELAVASGPLCSSCDIRAQYAGLLFEPDHDEG